jgi:DNA-binding XRE family transcriptional regulator
MTPSEFRALRETLGLSQPSLAKAFGVSERTIRNIETDAGDVPPRDALAIERLAQIQGVDV